MKTRIGLALALCCALLISAGAARAAARGGTYANAQHGYTLHYPAAWRRIAVQGADFAAMAPDRNAFVSVSVTRGTAGPGALRGALVLAFPQFGRVQEAPAYRGIVFQHVRGLLAQDLVTTNRGTTGAVLAVAVAHRGHLYVLLGLVLDTSARSADPESQAVLATISSTRFS